MGEIRHLRDIEIVLPKSTYIAGETIRGYVIVICDEGFECNRIPITLVGMIKTWIRRHYGNNSVTYRDKEILIDETLILYEGGIVYEGETRFDFSFRLPENLPPSYRSIHAKIIYELKAKVEVSWAIDPKDNQTINIIMPHSNVPAQKASGYCEDDGAYVIEVEAEQASICIGQEIPLRIRVSRDVKIRGIRFELIHHESTRARRVKETTKKNLYKNFIEAEDLTYDTWFEFKIPTSIATPPSFQTRLVTSYLIIKITLDIPWRFDKSVLLDILCGFCVEPHEDDEDYLFGDF